MNGFDSGAHAGTRALFDVGQIESRSKGSFSNVSGGMPDTTAEIGVLPYPKEELRTAE